MRRAPPPARGAAWGAAWGFGCFLAFSSPCLGTPITAFHLVPTAASSCDILLTAKRCEQAAAALGEHYIGSTNHIPKGCFLRSQGQVAWRTGQRHGAGTGASPHTGDAVCVKRRGRVDHGRVQGAGLFASIVLDTGDDAGSWHYESHFDQALAGFGAMGRDGLNEVCPLGSELCSMATGFQEGQQVFANNKNAAPGRRNGDAGVANGTAAGPDGRIWVRWEGGGRAQAVLAHDLRKSRACRGRDVCDAAAAASQAAWLEECLELDPGSVNTDCSDGKQPLGLAAGAGAEANTEALVEHSADVNHCTEDQLTALTAAVVQNKEGTVKLLARARADMQHKGPEGDTVLMTAARNGQPHMFQLLLDQRADPDTEDGKGWTALSWAVKGDCIDCIKQLLEEQYPGMDHADADGNTALHLAAGLGHAPAAMLLVKHGADRWKKNSLLQDPVTVAGLHAFPALAQQLRAAPAVESGATKAEATGPEATEAATKPETTASATDAAPAQDACTAAGKDCRAKRCCSDARLSCYEKCAGWAICRASCVPGSINPDDPPEYRSPWSCRLLSPNGSAPLPAGGAPAAPEPAAREVAPAQDACSAQGVNCRATRCCRDAGLTCYEKDAGWASCRGACEPGSINPKDPLEYRSPWTCRSLAAAAALGAGPPAPSSGWGAGPLLGGLGVLFLVGAGVGVGIWKHAAPDNAGSEESVSEESVSEEESLNGYIFISHCNKDQGSMRVYETMRTFLEHKDVKVFNPRTEFGHIEASRENMAMKAGDAAVVLAALSEHFFDSEYTQVEIQAAHEKGVHVIPLFSGTHYGSNQVWGDSGWIATYRNKHSAWKYMFKCDQAVNVMDDTAPEIARLSRESVWKRILKKQKR